VAASFLKVSMANPTPLERIRARRLQKPEVATNERDAELARRLIEKNGTVGVSRAEYDEHSRLTGGHVLNSGVSPAKKLPGPRKNPRPHRPYRFTNTMADRMLSDAITRVVRYHNDSLVKLSRRTAKVLVASDPVHQRILGALNAIGEKRQLDVGDKKNQAVLVAHLKDEIMVPHNIDSWRELLRERKKQQG